MLDSMSESWNPLILEEVMMCLVPSMEATMWHFDKGNQWSLHVSTEILCEYVISFRMDRNYLLYLQNRLLLSYTITLAIYLDLKTWVTKQVLQRPLNFDSKDDML